MQENPQDLLAALPILRVRLTADGPNKQLVIRSFNIDGSIDTVYNRSIVVAHAARLLHGFDYFSLRLRWRDPNEPLGIGFLETEAAIEIEADQPVVLLESSWVAGTKGTVAVHSSAAVYAEALQLHGLDIEAPAFRTAGIVDVHHAYLAVRDLALPHPFRATQDIAIEHGAGDFLIGDNAQAQGLLAIQFQSQDTLKQTFKALGSLHLSLAPTVTVPWVLLHHQEAERDLTLESPTPIKIGSKDKEVTLEAKTGYLKIKSGGSMLVIDPATQKEHAVGVRQSIQWHQLHMDCATLNVFGEKLDNVSSKIQVKQDALWDVVSSEHRLLLHTKTATIGGNRLHRLPVYGDSGMYQDIWEGSSQTILSHPAEVHIHGTLNSQGTTKVLGSQLYTANFQGNDIPQVINPEIFTSIIHDRSHDHPVAIENHGTYETVRCNISFVQAVCNLHAPLNGTAQELIVTGILSSSAMTIRMQDGQLGIQHSNQRSPAMRPFKRAVSFLDYASANSNLYEITPGGDTVYKSVFPPRALRPALDPIIVMNPNGTLSPATPGIPRFFTLEQEEQILVSLLMNELCRGSLRADVYEPEQMLSILKHRAAYQMLEENGNDANGNQALAFAGVGAVVGTAVKASMLASATTTAVAAGATTTGATIAATAGATLATVTVPTLSLVQTIIAGGLTGFSMSITQSLVMREKKMGKKALQGLFVGAVSAGVNLKLGKAAKTFGGRTLKAAIPAVADTAFNGGALFEKMLVSMASNEAAHTLAPIDNVNLVDLNRVEVVQVSLRTAEHAVVAAVTASAFNASPDFIMNIAIAAVGGMITPIAEAVGERLGEQVVTHQQKVRQAAMFKRELVRASENASQILAAQGIHIPAETIKTNLQQHPALHGTPEEVQARLIRRGRIEEGDSIQTGAAASLARGVAKVLGATLDLLIPAAHASEFTQEEYNQLDRQPEVSYAPTELAASHKPLLWQAPRARTNRAAGNLSLIEEQDQLLRQAEFTGALMTAGFLYQVGVQVVHGMGGMARFARDAYLSSDEDLRLFAPEAHQAARDRLTNRFRAVGHAVVHYEDTAQHMMQAMQASFASYQRSYEHREYFTAGRHLNDASAPALGLIPIGGTVVSALRFTKQLGVKAVRSSGGAITKLYDSRRNLPIKALEIESAALKFKPGQDLVHYQKHRERFFRAFGDYSYNLKNYVEDANFVVKNGTYVPELNAYVKIAGGRGDAKVVFVGLDRVTPEITTFHLKKVSRLELSVPSLGFTTKKPIDLIGPNPELGWNYPYRKPTP